jgi:hypothetical protein
MTATLPSIQIAQLLEANNVDLRLELVAGREGLNRKIPAEGG